MANKLSVELSLNAKGYQSEIDKSKEATNDFNKSVDDASKSTAQYTNTIGKQTKDLTSLRKQLAQSKKEAQNLAMAYNQLSDAEKNSGVGRQMKKQLDEAIQSAGNFQDVLGDVQRQIKNVASDTATWDTLSEGITVAGSALSSLGGAYASITGDQETFNKAIAMYTTTQSAATAITKVANLLQKESNLMMKIAAIQELAKVKAIAASTTATKGATVAQAAFNAVAMANPYVLLGTAIAGVTAALGGFIYAAGRAKEKQKELNDEIAKGRINFEDLEEGMDFTVRMMKAKGSSELEVINYEIDRYNKNLEGSTTRVEELNKRLEQVRSRINAAAQRGGTADFSDYQEQKAILAEIAIEEDKQAKINENINKLTKDRAVELARINTEEEKAAKKKEEDAKKEQENSKKGYDEKKNALHELQDDQRKLNDLITDAVAAGDTDLAKQHVKSLKEVEQQIQNIQDGIEELTATPMQKLQKEQKKLNDLLQEAIINKDNDAFTIYSGKLAAVNEQIDEVNKKLEAAKNIHIDRVPNVPTKFSEQVSKPKKDVTLTNPYPEKPKYTLNDFFGDTDQVFAAIGAVDSFQNSMSSLVQSIQEGANAWDIFTGAIAVVQSAMQTFQAVMEGIAAVQEIINTLTVVGTEKKKEEAVQTVSTAGAEISAESGKAVATATAEGTKAGWPALLWAIPAAIAAVVGALALIGSFEKGGIVPGSSFHGDNLVARVNSGEMILNQRQQKNMFDAIDSGSLGGGHVNVDGNITIKGSDLHVALRNYDKKISKIS